MTPEQELERGLQAQKAWDACKDRLTLMKEEVHRRWEQSNFKDIEGRDQAFMMIQAINQLEQSFKTDIDTAKLARAKLEKDNG